MLRNLSLGLIAAALCGPVFAQPSWYAGISAGRSNTNAELVANRESTITEASNLQTAFDAKDRAWKAFAGLRLNPVFALEIDYADLGTHTTLTSLQGGSPPLPAAIGIRRKVTGYGVDLVTTPPLGLANLSVFGRIGAFRTRLEAQAFLEGNIVFTNGNPDERSRSALQNETILRYGLGADWRLARNLSARVEWQRYTNIGKAFAIGGSGTTGEADTDVLSAGLLYHF